ncbi:hypothetical protein CO615_10705 [Lysobacteraceae bacterium NML75-0749]|nr:hypothetical protein CO615_10705 [Xanthomonadaceae bacterium NML75-0749]
MTYARFSAAPIGAGLIAQNGVLVTTSADSLDLHRAARLDIERNSGVCGVEFAFFGDDPLLASIGILPPGAPLTSAVGNASDAIGWRVHTGQLVMSGQVVASNLPIPTKGEVLGVQVDYNARKLRLYRGQTRIHERSLPAGAFVPAVSLSSTTAGGLSCALNAGQWQRATPAGTWTDASPAAALTLRLSDVDWLSAPNDAPANARYEAVIEDGGFDTLDALHFWPWGDAPRAVAAASVRLADAHGHSDALLAGDIVGLPVNVRAVTAEGALASATGVGRYVVSGLDVHDDMRRTLQMDDAHADLARPLNAGVFLPNIPQLAWQPQPLLIGAANSVPALPANSDASVLFVADTPLAHVSAVRDRGDAMEAGTWSLSPDGRQLLMQSPSLGPVVCDASSMGVSGGEPRPAKLAEFLRECFARIGKAAWSAADAEAIDAASGYAGIGYASRALVDAWTVITAALTSYGAWVWRDGDGVLRFARVIAPESVPASAVVATLDESDLLRDPVRVDDRAPALSRRMRYRPNGYIHGASDLVSDIVDVPPELRERLMSPAWGMVYDDAPLPALYRHADTAEPMMSLHWREQDAQAELSRVIGIYRKPRQSWRWELRDPALTLRPGQVVRATCRRYAELATGRQLLVRAIQRNAITGDTVLTLWG